MTLAVTVTAERSFEAIAIEDWHANFDLNLVGGVSCPARNSARDGARGKGSIINIASVSAHLPLSRVVTYSAAKAAVLNLTSFSPANGRRKAFASTPLTPGFFPAEQNRKLAL